MQKQYLLSKNRNHLQQMKGHGSQLINAYFNSDDLGYRYSSGENSCTDHFSVVQEGTAL